MFFVSLAGVALGLLLSAFVANPDRAASLVPIILIPQILFSGAIVKYSDLAVVGKVLSWFVAGNWGVQSVGGASGVGALLDLSTKFNNQQRGEAVTTPFFANPWLGILCLLLIAAVSVCVTVWALRRKDVQEQLAKTRAHSATPAGAPEVRTA
jgi:ABC-type multidrug transport system permease subunit